MGLGIGKLTMNIVRLKRHAPWDGYENFKNVDRDCEELINKTYMRPII